MRIAAILLSAAFNVVGGIVFAQGASDSMVLLRACFAMEGAARLECLEDLSRKIGSTVRPAPGGDKWIVSETTSPVNYAPIVTATTFSHGALDGSAMQLSIYCRGGRTELVVAGSAISRTSENYTISYRINDDQPMEVAAAPPSFGTGAAFTGDVIRLLQSFPEEGSIAVHLSVRTGAAQDGYFSFGGLKQVREKMAAACKWPQAVVRPSNNSHRTSTIGDHND